VPRNDPARGWDGAQDLRREVPRHLQVHEVIARGRVEQAALAALRRDLGAAAFGPAAQGIEELAAEGPAQQGRIEIADEVGAHLEPVRGAEAGDLLRRLRQRRRESGDQGGSVQTNSDRRRPERSAADYSRQGRGCQG
jgi:hypothetical protein